MTSIDPAHLPSPHSFEIYIYLILQKEFPKATIRRNRAPDHGIDITVITENEIIGYQCKHYPNPQIQTIKKEVIKSLTSAINNRQITKWNKLVFCFSKDLTSPQTEEIYKTAREFGLTNGIDFGVRAGTSFLTTAYKIPKIWQIATLNSTVFNNYSLDNDNFLMSNLKLEKLFKEWQKLGTKVNLPNLMRYEGIQNIESISDWYLLAEPYIQATQRILRSMSFDTEIPQFWLTEHGGKYFETNKQLVQKGVNVNRLFLLNFDLSKTNRTNLRFFLRYCQEHEEQGLNSKILPLEVYTDLSPIDCKAFGMIDKSNVIIYSHNGHDVSFVSENNNIKELIDAYDELFMHSEAKSPIYFLKKFNFL